MGHEQTLVKVNAKVDRGVAALVESLNRFPEVCSLSSCEGDADRWAFVSFTIDDQGSQQVGEFLSKLSLSLRENSDLCDSSCFSLCLEWYTGSEIPAAFLRVPHKHVQKLAQAVAEIATSSLIHEVVP